MKKISLFICICAALFVFVNSSVWEGAAVAASGGELPENGHFIATNSFPVNTMVDVTNLENGKTIRAVVSSGIESPGLLALLSKDTAGAIGLESRSVGRISMSQPPDPIAFSRFSDGSVVSGDPDFDPAAYVALNGYALAQPDKSAGESESPDSSRLEGGDLIVDLPGTESVPPVVAAVPAGAGDIAEPEPVPVIAETPAESEAAEPGPVESEPVPAIAETPAESEVTEPAPASAVAETPVESEAAEPEPAPAIAETPVESEAAEPEPAPAIAEVPVESEVAEPEPAPVVAETPVESEVAEPEPAPAVAETPVESEVTEPAPAPVVAETPAESEVTEPAPSPSEVAEPRYDLSLVPAENRPPEKGPEPLPAQIIPGISSVPPAANSSSAYIDSSDVIDPVAPPAVAAQPVQVTPYLPELLPSVPASPVFSAPMISGLEKGKYYLQIAAFSKTESVRAEIERIDNKLPVAIMNTGNAETPLYRILIGPVNLGESGALLQRFKRTHKDAFVRLGS